MESVAIVRNAGEPVTSEAGVTHPSLVSLGVLHFVRGRVSRESDVAGIGCPANRMPREHRLYEMQEHLLPVGQV